MSDTKPDPDCKPPESYTEIWFLGTSIEIDTRFEVFDIETEWGEEVAIKCPNCGEKWTELDIAEECYEYANNESGKYDHQIECECGAKIRVKYRLIIEPRLKIETITLEENG